MATTNLRRPLCVASLLEQALRTLGRPVWRVVTIMMASMTAASLLSADDLSEECKKYESVRIPPGDQPTAAQVKALGDCDSGDLYYGSNHPPDYVKARLCAYAKIARNESRLGGFDGSTILMMVYANGKGVARNFDLAMRFACQASSYTTERLQHLEKLKAENWKGSDFDYCDDVLLSERDLCQMNLEGFADAKRKKQMGAIMSKWSAQNKQAFAKVEQAEKEYTDALQRYELDTNNGNSWHAVSRGMLSDTAETTLSVISRLETGKFPDSKNTGFAKADAELNAVYSEKLRELKKREVDGTLNAAIRANGVQATERLWLKYLAAWIAFVQNKYPLAPADGVRTWLTEARIMQLRELMIY
jgi:hypothetical protein